MRSNRSLLTLVFIMLGIAATDASAQTPQATRVALIAGVLAVGLIVRWPWRDFVSDDWTTFLQYWQRFLIAFGGFPALRYAFSNYSAPYQYLLAITTQTLGMLPPMHQVKLVSVVFDAGMFTKFIPNTLARN